MGFFDKKPEHQPQPEPPKMQPAVSTTTPPPPVALVTRPDWAKFSIPDLEIFVQEIEQEITTRQERERQDVLEKMKALAASIGLSVGDLLGKPAKTSGRSIVKAKYKHPSGATWSGRGKPPKIFQEWKDSGKDIEELAIK